jgi:hypothetical protein
MALRKEVEHIVFELGANKLYDAVTELVAHVVCMLIQHIRVVIGVDSFFE